jgi:hypothetical protein
MIRYVRALLILSLLSISPAQPLDAQVGGGGPGGCHLCDVHNFGVGNGWICDICIHHTFFGYASCAQLACDDCHLQGYPCGVFADVPEALLENRRQLLEAMPGGFSIAVAGRWLDVEPQPNEGGEADRFPCAGIPDLEALLWASATDLYPVSAGL